MSTKLISVRVDEDMWVAVKAQAITERTTVEKLVTEGLGHVLHRRPARGQEAPVARSSSIGNVANMREPVTRPSSVDNSANIREPEPRPAPGHEVALPPETDLCRRCDHRRRHHVPQRCTQMGCPCSRFLEAKT